MAGSIREAFSTPAVVHEDLFSWARKQAVEARQRQEALALAVAAEAEARASVEGLAQYALAEEAKSALANAKKAALDEDPVVAEAKALLKKQRRALKATMEAATLKLRKQETRFAEEASRSASRELVERLAK